MTFGPSLCNVQCRCGHVADLDEFAVAPNRYRCPACGYRWRVETVGHATITPWGTVIPADRRCVEDVPA